MFNHCPICSRDIEYIDILKNEIVFVSFWNNHSVCRNQDQIWHLLLECYQAGFLMATSCTVRAGDSKERYHSLGLQTAHAYSVLQVREVYVMQETMHVIELRNPWVRLYLYLLVVYYC